MRTEIGKAVLSACSKAMEQTAREMVSVARDISTMKPESHDSMVYTAWVVKFDRLKKEHGEFQAEINRMIEIERMSLVDEG